MTLRDERVRMLDMIQSGQGSAGHGIKLLAALQRGGRQCTRPEGGQPRWFRVLVTDLKAGRAR
jgi:hypothetical protein